MEETARKTHFLPVSASHVTSSAVSTGVALDSADLANELMQPSIHCSRILDHNINSHLYHTRVNYLLSALSACFSLDA